jgi:hypothetical protein
MNDKYKGMTVNERLYVSGLIDKFDDVVEKKQIDEIVEILKKVGISKRSQIIPILENLGLEMPKDIPND